MNIWAWVQATQRELRSHGHERLAKLIDEIPSAVCDDRFQEVEALVPEALSLARALDHAWLEVFIRHWLMQSRIVNQMDVRTGLADAIDLLDFAHGERTQDCPQSVCVTQDVAVAYASGERTAYIEERLAVCDETLSRIDPSWGCYECISCQRAGALLDGGRVQECERFCREQLARARRVGQRPEMLELKLARALSLQGHAERALRVAQRVPFSSPNRNTSTQLVRCACLAQLQRYAEAIECFVVPARAATLPPTDYGDWAECAEQLVAGGVLDNDAELAAVLDELACSLRNKGALSAFSTVTAIAGRLALQRGAAAVAKRHLQALQALLPELRRPQPTLDACRELEARLATADSAAGSAQD